MNMMFATTIASVSSRQVRNSHRALLRGACRRSSMLQQQRCQSSIGYESFQESRMANCDVFSAEDDENNDRLLNDLAYSLSMASDSKVFPLGHRPNRRQQRQLWLSKTQPLLGKVWIGKESFRPAKLSDETEEKAWVIWNDETMASRPATTTTSSAMPMAMAISFDPHGPIAEGPCFDPGQERSYR